MVGLKRVLVVTALLACLGQGTIVAAIAETRIALVIGNGAYRNAPQLPNPSNDANEVAAALRRDGFETILATDLDKSGMDEAEIRFAKAARVADVAFFYYSGHALQFAGVNYLAPVDIKLTDEADLRRMVRVDDILADLQQAKSLRILVLDSCRDNPLADDLKRAIGVTRALPLQRGLAKIETPQGTIISYATQAGHTAADGAGANSPYTTAFLKHIEEQAEIGTIFRRISADVYEGTRHAQLPELSLSLIGEYFLRGLDSGSGMQAKSTEVIHQESVKATDDDAARAWEHVKDTENVELLDAFMTRYASTFYADLARAKIRELKSKVVLAPSNSTPSSSDIKSKQPSRPDTPRKQVRKQAASRTGYHRYIPGTHCPGSMRFVGPVGKPVLVCE